MLSHERLWAAIDALAARNSLSASGLAKLAGLDSTTFNKSKRHSSDGRPRWPSTESLAKIMQATQSSLDEFLALLGDVGQSSRRSPGKGSAKRRAMVPLVGHAQAGPNGHYDSAGFEPGDGFERVELPDEAVEGAFALGVKGDSMLPLYRNGDILIVKPVTTPRKGDRVVVRTVSGEVMAKILERQSADSIELGSLNADHPQRSLHRSEIRWLGRIIWVSQ